MLFAHVAGVVVPPWDDPALVSDARRGDEEFCLPISVIIFVIRAEHPGIGCILWALLNIFNALA